MWSSVLEYDSSRSYSNEKSRRRKIGLKLAHSPTHDYQIKASPSSNLFADHRDVNWPARYQQKRFTFSLLSK